MTTQTTLERLAWNTAISCIETLALKRRDLPGKDYAEDIEPVILEALKKAYYARA